MNTYNQSCLLEALETVLAWELPDEAIPEAVGNQFRLMTGIDPEDVLEHCPDNFLTFHH